MSAVEIEIIGIAAACLVNVSMLPQILKTAMTKQARDISLPFWTILFVGAFLWTVYGISTRGVALILSSVVTCGLCIAMIALVLKYR